MAKNKGGKKPRFDTANRPTQGKVPVAVEKVPSLKRPAWRFGMVDHEGPWPLLAMEGEHIPEVISKLAHFESMTWVDISGPKSHRNYDGICNEAKKRLRDRNFEEWADHLYSLRLRGAWRLWGLLIEGVFHILWWDPNHKVYPTGPN